MDNDLRTALCRNITARAHIAGAESMEPGPAGAAARRRYWREIAACWRLMGWPSEQAEKLGRESNA